jgi:hypothetical protein
LSRSKIVIGDIESYFLLPRLDPPGQESTPGSDSGAFSQALGSEHSTNFNSNSHTHLSVADADITSSKRPKKRVKTAASPDDDDANNPYERPNVSYATMISQAIHASGPEKKLTLAGIYQWISENYPYYRMSSTGWQVSLADGWIDWDD